MGGRLVGAGLERGVEGGRPLELGGPVVGGEGPLVALPRRMAAVVKGGSGRVELGRGVGRGLGQGMVMRTLTMLPGKGGAARRAQRAL